LLLLLRLRLLLRLLKLLLLLLSVWVTSIAVLDFLNKATVPNSRK
jgi:hypothetical protein